MARIYRRQRTIHPVAELNVTNLVDLGFTLLIIFMISTPLIQNEQTIPVNLPEQSKTAQPKADPDVQYRSITIDREGNFAVDGVRMSFAQLSVELDAMAAQPKQPVVRIRGDMSVQYQKVVQVMDELMKRKLTKISIDTQTK